MPPLCKASVTLLSTALLMACQTPQSPPDDRHISERITVYTFEKLNRPGVEEETYEEVSEFPPPAPIDDGGSAGEGTGPVTRVQNGVECPIFSLPTYKRLPPLPVLTPEERRNPDLAAKRLVDALQETRKHFRDTMGVNERAYLEYRTSCKLH